MFGSKILQAMKAETRDQVLINIDAITDVSVLRDRPGPAGPGWDGP